MTPKVHVHIGHVALRGFTGMDRGEFAKAFGDALAAQFRHYAVSGVLDDARSRTSLRLDPLIGPLHTPARVGAGAARRIAAGVVR